MVLGLESHWVNANFVEYCDFYPFIADMWASVIGPVYWDWSRGGEAPHTRVETIRHWRTLQYYVSKYLGNTSKGGSFALPCPMIVQQAAQAATGVRFDSAGEFEDVYCGELFRDVPAVSEQAQMDWWSWPEARSASFGFTYVTYRTVLESSLGQAPGRFWGFMFRDRWPEGELTTIELPFGEWLTACKAIWAFRFRLSYRNGTGFTKYTTRPAWWVEQAKEFQRSYCADEEAA